MPKSIRLKRKPNRADYSAERYRVTLFQAKGVYPQGTFCSPTAIFHADSDIAFCVSFGSRWHTTAEHLPYSEVDWLLPDVVRLLGALIMTERFSDGMRTRFYPVPHSGFILDEATVDLTRPETGQAIKSALLRTVGNRLWPRHTQLTWDACLDRPFFLFDAHEQLEVDDYQRIWLNTSTDNHVLMRGLQALIKADMLSAHYEFQEEATIATFIALDASFELVLRHLRQSGVVNPSAQHAGDWLYDLFEEPLGVYRAKGLKYFEEFYAQRVQTVHPGSRLGDVPYAPVMADDYIHLRSSLPQVFGYLTLGEHTAQFRRLVEERQARFTRSGD